MKLPPLGDRPRFWVTLPTIILFVPRTLLAGAAGHVFCFYRALQRVKMQSGPVPLLTALCIATVALLAPRPSYAWGYEGHEVVASIAQSYLQPSVRAKIETLLAEDQDRLTGRDMVARSTWADAWRGAGHRQTAEWHYADVEIDAPDLAKACFDFPKPAQPVSAGPPKSCVIDRVNAFAAELSDPKTPREEQILALKYLLHFVGDMHQPLHMADNHDRGGNCGRLVIGRSRSSNLHTYWDRTLIEGMGTSSKVIAGALRSRISTSQRSEWERGDPRSWGLETFAVAKAAAYRVRSAQGCAKDAAPVPLPAGYTDAARAAAEIQLERAGVRLALVLNRALALVPVAPATPKTSAPNNQEKFPSVQPPRPSPDAAAGRSPGGRTPGSIECSTRADKLGLHGQKRKDYRTACRKIMG